MSNSFVEERSAIGLLFSTGWGNTTPVEYPNAEFTPEPNVNYVRLTILTGDAKRVEISGVKRYTRSLGMIIVSIFVKAGTGDLISRQLGDIVAGIFRAASASMTDGEIRFREPTRNEIGISDNENYYQMNVNIPFYRDEVL